MMIELTDERFEKFWINTDLVRTLHPMLGNKTRINFVNSGHEICIESNEKVAKLINDAIRGEDPQ